MVVQMEHTGVQMDSTVVLWVCKALVTVNKLAFGVCLVVSGACHFLKYPTTTKKTHFSILEKLLNVNYI